MKIYNINIIKFFVISFTLFDVFCWYFNKFDIGLIYTEVFFVFISLIEYRKAEITSNYIVVNKFFIFKSKILKDDIDSIIFKYKHKGKFAGFYLYFSKLNSKKRYLIKETISTKELFKIHKYLLDNDYKISYLNTNSNLDILKEGTVGK